MRAHLQQQSVPMAAALEAVREGVFVLNRHQRYVFWNNEMERLFGVSSEQVVDETDSLERFPLLQAHGLAKIFEQVMSGRAVERHDVKFDSPDGRALCIDERYTPWLDSSNNVQGMIGFLADITSENGDQSSAVDSGEMIDTVIEMAPIVLFTLDKTGVFTMSRGQGLEGLNLRPGEVVGTSVYDVYRDYPDVSKAMDRALAGEAFSEILELGELVFEVCCAPLLDRAGEQIGVRGVAIDVTEAARQEELIQLRGSDLSRAYIDVLCAVTNDKLQIMSRDELGRALGEPLGEPLVVAHISQLQAVRASLRRHLMAMLVDPVDVDAVVVAAGEAATNGIKHGGGCQIQLYQLGRTTQIEVTDSGSGIDFSDLPRAVLSAGFSTKGSLGVGFSIMLEICDHVFLATDPQGTTVLLEAGDRAQSGSLENVIGRSISV